MYSLRGMFCNQGVFRSAWPVGYRVRKASDRIRSLLDALSIGVCQIDRAERPVIGGL